MSTLTVTGATSVKHTHTTKKLNFTNITLEGCQIHAMIDPGVEANVILESQVPDKIRHLTKTHIQLQPYGSKLITPKDVFTAHTYWKDKKCKSKWIVVDDDDLSEKNINLVSCNLAESQGIITFNTPSMEIKGSLIISMGTKMALTDDATELTKSVRPPIVCIITQHPSVFHGLGKMKAEPTSPRHQPLCRMEQRERTLTRLHKPTFNTITQATSTYCRRNKGTPTTIVPITQHTPLRNCYHQRTLRWSPTQRHKSNVIVTS